MNIQPDLNRYSKEGFQEVNKDNLTNGKNSLFKYIVENKDTIDKHSVESIIEDSFQSEELTLVKALFSKDYGTDDIFNKAIFGAIEDGNSDGLKALSVASSLNAIRTLTSTSSDNDNSYFGSSNSISTLYEKYLKKDMITELEVKLKKIEINISKTEDEKIKSAYQEEYKIFSKVLEKYKEFQKEDEKILAQMIRNHKQNPLI
jgi:hypothetical protein